jgi:outer membrane protein TolC
MEQLINRITYRMEEIKESVDKLEGAKFDLSMGTLQNYVELEKLKAQYAILKEQLQYIKTIEK